MRTSIIAVSLPLLLIACVASLVLATTSEFPLMDQEQEILGLPHRNGSVLACEELGQKFPDQVLRADTTSNGTSEPRYWSMQQGDLTPACIFLPNDKHDVRGCLHIIIQHNTTLAVASGGHSSVAGASNVADGITIDLSRLSEIELVPGTGEDDLGTVWLGPGARWDDVYAALEPHGLTVSGGRVSDVGVGGYILGGGLSWFANQYGWTCDSVLEFEVVTPKGEMLSASRDSHPDLFWALKGSLGAFGIVTRIRVPALRDRKIYGGALSYDEEHLEDVMMELNKLGRQDSELDPSTQGYLSFGWTGKDKRLRSAMYMVDTDGKGTTGREGERYMSPLIHRFKAIPHIGSSMRPMTLCNSAAEIAQSNTKGLRRSKFTVTTECNTEAMQIVYWACGGLLEDSGTVLQERDMLGATIQPLTKLHQAHQNNVFNLPSDSGPLLLVSVEMWWEDAAFDETNEAFLSTLIDMMGYGLGWAGFYHPFTYPNYAAKWQQPFADLPAEIEERLKRVKQRYDPDDVWRKLVPGIWHI